ncbi:MAG: hypothetical protein ACE5GO_10135 [Anaerolineales bacterium]
MGECDPGDANTVTSAFAQGFKRSCADFGLGRYLYFLPQRWCDYDAKKKQITAPPGLPIWALPKGRANGRKNGKTNGRPAADPAGDAAAPDPDSTPGRYVVPWGKNEGQRLDALDPRWIEWYAHQMKPTTPERQETQHQAIAYPEILAPQPS